MSNRNPTTPPRSPANSTSALDPYEFREPAPPRPYESWDAYPFIPNNPTAEEFESICEQANYCRQAYFWIESYVKPRTRPNEHLTVYGYADEIPDPDPGDWNALHEMVIACLRLKQMAISAEWRPHYGQSVRWADKVIDYAIEAFHVGCCPDRIERAVGLVFGLAGQHHDRFASYNTTRTRCDCPDQQIQRPRRCKHQIAMLMLKRLERCN